MECPRKVERRIGKLEEFKGRGGAYQARVRVGDLLFNLPPSSRGVLQPDKSIALCANGDRYEPIAKDSLIVLDLVYDHDEKNPCPGMWAPKIK